MGGYTHGNKSPPKHRLNPPFQSAKEALWIFAPTTGMPGTARCRAATSGLSRSHPSKLQPLARAVGILVLTPTRPVPHSWFPDDLDGKKILCLASAGGQQGPILAAAGAQVTVFDNSPAQLAQDRLVAERDSLQIETIEGDMADLAIFAEETFDLIFHPVSNLFVPRLQPVWNESGRVLKPGGRLLGRLCKSRRLSV